ncbi:MAG: PASTA domain-containing protein [Actinobacteria bacterium]|nr:MAG: PASTA domain-containing protein [Actinomycetota bacterium]
MVLATAAMVSLAILPPILAIGRAAQLTDAKLLGSTNRNLVLPSLPERSTIYAADGSVLATLFQDENRVYVPLAQIAPIARQAVLAVEDHSFYSHGAVDVISILRAALANLNAGKIVQGGSTITQQLVKNTEVGTEETFRRKFQEAQDAIRLERTYSKDQILEMYLNESYFGNRVYGIGTAAEFYFATSADKLTLPQAALLAGMLQAPVLFDPITNPTDALVRRNIVLKDMEAFNVQPFGQISESEYETASSTPIVLSSKKRGGNAFGPEPYWISFIVNQFENDPSFGATIADRAKLLFQGGLHIYTTLDRGLQKYARLVIERHLPKAGPKPPADPQGALATINPDTGAIVALVGGTNYEKSKFDLAWQGRRSTGSAFKAYTLTAAMEQGVPPGRVYKANSPQTVDGCQAGGWTVNNAEPGLGGYMNLWDATTHSVNVVFAQLIRDVGPLNVLNTAAAMGIPRSNMQPVCSLTLGTGVGTNPLEMASGYATLANGGKHCQPFAVSKVLDREGNQVFKAKPSCKQVVPPDVAAQVTAMLRNVICCGTGTAAQLNPPRPEAGKTGTGQNYQDAWFCGYVPQLSTAVWVGYSSKEIPMRGLRVLGGGNAFGGTLAAPIWHDVMQHAVQGLPAKNFPNPPPQKGGTVPDVTGMQQKDAENTLTKANFVPIDKNVASAEPKGTVVSQDPKGGSVRTLGSGVTINISTGVAPKVVVPDVVGQTQDAATAALQADGFVVVVVYQMVIDQQQIGIVLSQDPAAGKKVAQGSTVTITVGQGPSP